MKTTYTILKNIMRFVIFSTFYTIYYCSGQSYTTLIKSNFNGLQDVGSTPVGTCAGYIQTAANNYKSLLPWTSTQTLNSTYIQTHSGWNISTTIGTSLYGYPSGWMQNALGFTANGSGGANGETVSGIYYPSGTKSNLRFAIDKNNYVSFKMRIKAGAPLNLSGGKINITYQRSNSCGGGQTADSLSVFIFNTATGPFPTTSNKLLTFRANPNNLTNNLPDAFSSTIPGTLNLSAGQEYEFRIYIHGQQYGFKWEKITAFEIQAVNQNPITEQFRVNFTGLNDVGDTYSGTTAVGNKIRSYLPWRNMVSGVATIASYTGLYFGSGISTWGYPVTAAGDGLGYSANGNGAGDKSNLSFALAGNLYFGFKFTASASQAIDLNKATLNLIVARLDANSTDSLTLATNFGVTSLTGTYSGINKLDTRATKIYATGQLDTLKLLMPSGFSVPAGQTYEFRVYAHGQRYGFKYEVVKQMWISSGDLTPPSAPVISVSAPTSYGVKFNLTPSFDNIGVTSYTIYKNGQVYQTINGGTLIPELFVGGLAPNTTISVYVKSSDYAGNVAYSNTVSGTTTTPVYPNDNSPLGTNLSGISSWTTEMPFVNLVKQSRSWGELTGPWVALNNSVMGVNGYLAGGQTGALMVIDGFGPNILAKNNKRYVLRWEGTGNVIAKNTVNSPPNNPIQISSVPGRNVISIPGGFTGSIGVYVTSNSTTDPVRNLWFAEEEYESYYTDQSNPDKIFRPEFINNWNKFKVLRFMDMMSTNGSPIVNWSDYPDINFIRWNRVPVEVMVKLCNKIHADGWFNMPHGVNNAFVTSFAGVVKNNLTSDLKAYIEYSNEIWNWSFGHTTTNYASTTAPGSNYAYRAADGIYYNLNAQNSYCLYQGRELGYDYNNAHLQYQAKRSVEIFNLWKTAFGGSTARLVRVIAGQAGNTAVSSQVLGFQNAYQSADAYATAPYFGGGIANANAAVLTTMGLSAAVTSIIGLCSADINTSIATRIATDRATCNQRNLHFISYEGGQHLVGTGGLENSVELMDRIIGANRDPRMKDLYLQYLDVWKANGGEMFCHFSSTGTPSKWGSWGSKEYTDQPRNSSEGAMPSVGYAYKYDALLTWIASHPKYFNLRREENAAELSQLNNGSVLIYPNPTSGDLHILAEPGEIIFSIRVLSGYGTDVKVVEGLSTPQYTIDIQGVATGIYLIKVQTSAGSKTVKVYKD